MLTTTALAKTQAPPSLTECANAPAPQRKQKQTLKNQLVVIVQVGKSLHMRMEPFLIVSIYIYFRALYFTKNQNITIPTKGPSILCCEQIKKIGTPYYVVAPSTSCD